MNDFQLIEKNYNQVLNTLNEKQKEAVLSEEERVLIKAPPGSGKTTTLIAAILAHKYNYLNDKICAITFTRAAADEMRARLVKMGITDVNVLTIHSWSNDCLKNLAVNYGFQVRILKETDIRLILQELIRKYLIQHNKIKSINIDILYNYITTSKKIDVSENFRRTLNALHTRYLNYKKINYLYDFTDYPQYLYDTLVAYKEKITGIDALFVDEFQDVDEVQLKIFNLVCAHKFFYIGDKLQSIYQFRGADGEAFEKIDNFKVITLDINYRSYQEIIDYSTTVYYAIKDQLDKDDQYVSYYTAAKNCEIRTSKKSGGKIYIINPFEEVYENGQLIQKSPQQIIKEFMQLNPMILCRTNKQVRAIQALNYYNVETVHQAKGLEYDNVIYVDSTISCSEDLNIAYVGLTRTKNHLLIVNWQQLEYVLYSYMNRI